MNGPWSLRKRGGTLIGVGACCAVLTLGAGESSLEVCNGPFGRYDAVVAYGLENEREAANYRVEEVGPHDAERGRRVPAFVDRTGAVPELVWRMPGVTRAGQTRNFRVVSCPVDATCPPCETDLTCRQENGSIIVGTRHFEIAHPLKGRGGFPNRVHYRGTGRTDDAVFIFDRLYKSGLGVFVAQDDPDSTARVVLETPLRVVVETRTRYLQGGRPAPDGLHATYRFVYTADSPSVEVTALIARDREKTPIDWQEVHFLHLSHADRHYEEFVLGPNAEVKPIAPQGGRDAKTFQWYSNDWEVMQNADECAGVGGGPVGSFDNANREFYYYVVRNRDPLPADEFERHCEGVLYFGPPSRSANWLDGWLGPQRRPRVEVGGELAVPKIERPSTPPDGATVLETGRSRIVFADAGKGFACRGVLDKETGVEFFRGGNDCPGLWRLVFRAGPAGREVALDNRRVRPGQVERTEQGVRFVWRGLDLADEKACVDVRCDVTREGEDFAFRIQVANRSGTFGLFRTDYPLLGEAIPSGTGESLIPFCGNWGHKLVKNNRTPFRAEYPGFAVPMQFLAFHRHGSGVYFGCQDESAATKVFHVDAANNVSVETPAEEAGVPGQAGAPKWATVLSTYRGTWWRAAEIYRAWAVRQAWTRKGPIAGRTDYPWRLAENGFWLQIWGEPRDVERSVSNALERVNGRTKFGIHWYGWNQVPFDTRYPEFFPARDGFAESARRMGSWDVLVMPYVNGRLWDRDIPSFAAARPFATKDERGEVRVETYGSGSWLAAMCPATDLWARRLSDLGAELVGAYGVNALYIDQIGSAPPVTCFDPAHGHPRGGGSHWAGGYRRLLASLRERIKGTVLTTENTAEPYMDVLDAYLTWTADDADDVPTLPAVYSGYTSWFASAGDPRDDPVAFSAYVTRDTLWGCQPGWMGNNWILDDAHKVQFERLVRLGSLRSRAADYFARGRLLGEVENRKANPFVSLTWHCRKVQNVMIRSVMAVVWEAPTGSRLLAVANLSGEMRAFAGTPPGGDAVELTLAPGDVKLVEYRPR